MNNAEREAQREAAFGVDEQGEQGMITYNEKKNIPLEINRR